MFCLEKKEAAATGNHDMPKIASQIATEHRVQYFRKIWYRVVRPIAPGDELLTHYGGSSSKILGTSRVCAVGMREHVGLEATWQRKKKKNQTPAPPKTAPPNRMN